MPKNNVKLKIQRLLDKLPYIRGLRKQLSEYKTLYPPGHYYSPINNPDKALKYSVSDSSLLDKTYIDFNDSIQLENLVKIKALYEKFPFTDEAKKNELKYNSNNSFYNLTDTLSLYGIIKNYMPQQIIEVGSGFSSAAMYDINKNDFNNKIKLCFIEPNPEDRLFKIFTQDEFSENMRVYKAEVEHIDLDLFKSLNKNDILFIDSSHIIKYQNDLHYLFFKVLPELSPGVIIHFHDIFYPFEYPQPWIREGRSWNEIYFIQAFLAYNQKYKIIFFNNYLQNQHSSIIKSDFPQFNLYPGQSLWLQKN